MNFRNVFYWIFGSLCILAGVLVASGIAAGGFSAFSSLDSVLALVVALLLLMFGGLLWIGVAVITISKKGQV
ncbi:MAG: hypothetical protein V1820_05715 [archaeon]